ncbi:hypothetical protein [Nocardioides sp. GXQ0305]|uniref:hypothetical protein n=1 Tax=Nocardioides sp. GXQ0305 TaxID=3423912 RepID=UPI003D7DA987
MASMLIQVDADLSDELSGAFPHLTARHGADSTTLIGKVTDQQELLGVMNLLVSMGIEILVVLRIPDE